MDGTKIQSDAFRTGVGYSALLREVFPGLDGGGMNACVACCDRWVADGTRVGLESFDGDGGLTYAALQRDAARFANLLAARGVCPGDVVAGILPRGAEMLTVVLGTWRAGAVYQPIASLAGAPAFGASAFSTMAIAARINHTGKPAAKLIVTDMANRPILERVDYCPPVLVVTGGAAISPGDGDFVGELSRQPAGFAPVPRDGDDPFILLTGGGGGETPPLMPKLRSLLPMLTSIQIGLDPREADIGWDVTDPAWSTTFYYPVIRPLLPGHAAIVHAGDNQASVTIVTPARKENPRRAAAPRHREPTRLVA